MRRNHPMKKISKTNPFLLTAASIALTLGIAACNKNQTPDNSAQNQAAQPDQTQPADQSQQDPAAAANLAPASATQPAASAPAPSSAPAPAPSPASNNQQYQSNSNDSDSNSNDNNYNDEDDDSNYGQPVLQASAPPPELPEYSQPDCPGDGYLWTPGYWSFGPQGYFWVPGAWTQPPQVGYLWTPGYWGYVGGSYRYHYGYLGPHIGYYGGGL